jgi:L-lactate dehydrogenase
MEKRISFIVSFIFLSLISTAAPRKMVTCEPTRYTSSGHSRIAVIGVGAVGATIAYSILMRDIASEIILVDICSERCMGEVFDMSDAIPASSTAHITLGSIQEAGRADIIIIAAGARRKPGQSRLDLIRINKKIVTSIVENLIPINPRAVVVVVSNPVDIMTLCVQRLAGLPLNQIFGSGTYLDTMRLRCFIADKLAISPQSINAYILGEHGDSQFVVWSSAQIAGIPLKNFAGMAIDELEALAQSAKQKGQDIITLKDATSYGVAACVADICESIIFNQKRVFPVSVYHEKFGVCFSLPVVIGENGIEQILPVSLNEQENAKLLSSAKKLSEAITDSISCQVS